MKRSQKNVVMSDRGCDVLHIETPLGVINIRIGLTDRLGRAVEAVQIIPNDLAGEPKVVVRGTRLVRLKGKAK